MTAIEWADRTWNPIIGCTRVSEGCERCYAERHAHRLARNPKTPQYAGLTISRGGGHSYLVRWTGEVRVLEDRMALPLSWAKPARVFVNSMGDLFHERIADSDIGRVFSTMAAAPRHTFIVLTKRADRMRAWVTAAAGVLRDWPLPNVQLGVSVENHDHAEDRIPELLQTPAAVRLISYEPALGPLNLRQLRNPGLGEGQDFLDVLKGYAWTCTGPDYYDVCGIGAQLDHVIIGGESGPLARPCNVDWLRSVIQDCRDTGVPVFVKQLGSHPVWGDTSGRGLTAYESRGVGGISDPKSGDPLEWPADLRVRELPVAM